MSHCQHPMAASCKAPGGSNRLLVAGAVERAFKNDSRVLFEVREYVQVLSRHIDHISLGHSIPSTCEFHHFFNRYGGFLSHRGSPESAISRWFFPRKIHHLVCTPISGTPHMDNTSRWVDFGRTSILRSLGRQQRSAPTLLESIRTA